MIDVKYIRILTTKYLHVHISCSGIEFGVLRSDEVQIHVVPALFVERELAESKKYCDPNYLSTHLQVCYLYTVIHLQLILNGLSLLR